ncbi:3',5'-cyclic adenosine monophosphate phosphodiesterase CpdA [bioreactor metagenome]|uniref:3',5'-cyclic adenosine monophosphate phosphodiesterase CpdA n=1 Tax=bioreactor metagenome TaxID=1076179 RepID=A0A644UYS4_9ZZZZ|nr:metallophosphoesterase [Paludibacter sp.]
MEVVIKQRIHLLLISVLLSSCIGDTDLTGFIRSTDRIEDRFKASMEWNTSNPFKTITVASEAYNLLLASDVHVGETENYQKFLQQGIQNDIEALIFVGDFVTGKEKDYEKFNDLLPDYETKPRFLLTGNHELYFDGWKHFQRLYGTSIYYFTVQTPSVRDLYICLDSGSGTLGKSQLAWLKNLLQQGRNLYNQCVIFTHVNFFRDRHTLSTNPLVNELLVLLDLFEKYRVNLVVMGHDHVRAENQLGNTTYLTLDGLEDEIPNASYLLLKKEISGITYQFIGVK